MRLKARVHFADGCCRVAHKMNVVVFGVGDDDERHELVLREVTNGIVHALVGCHVDVGDNSDGAT